MKSYLPLTLLFYTHFSMQSYAPLEDGAIMDPQYDSALITLDQAKDQPYRYDAILPVPSDSHTFMHWFLHENIADIYTPNYVHYRHLIAQAVVCGYRNANFMNIACHKQDAHLVEFLFKHKAADHNQNTIFDEAPIFSAQSITMIKLLEQYGASLKTRTKLFEKTLLHNACHDDFSEGILDYYVKTAGIDINDRAGILAARTPLHDWANHALADPVRPKNLNVALKKLDILMQAGADHTLTDYDGKTALEILNANLAQYERYQTLEQQQPAGHPKHDWSPQINTLKTVIRRFHHVTRQRTALTRLNNILDKMINV